MLNTYEKNYIFIFYINVEIYNFWFPFNKKLINKDINKKKFIINLYKLYKNFPFNLRLKIFFFLIFIQVFPIFFNFKFFSFLNLNQKKLFLNRLRKIKIQILIKGLFAIKSQTFIIYYSIFKGKLNHG